MAQASDFRLPNFPVQDMFLAGLKVTAETKYQKWLRGGGARCLYKTDGVITWVSDGSLVERPLTQTLTASGFHFPNIAVKKMFLCGLKVVARRNGRFQWLSGGGGYCLYDRLAEAIVWAETNHMDTRAQRAYSCVASLYHVGWWRKAGDQYHDSAAIEFLTFLLGRASLLEVRKHPHYGLCIYGSKEEVETACGYASQDGEEFYAMLPPSLRGLQQKELVAA